MMQGKIIELRAIERSDVETLYRYENDEQLWQDGFNRHPLSFVALNDFIDRSLEGDIFALRQERLVIADKTSHAPLGCIDAFEFNPYDLTCEIGIVVDAAHRRKGIATESINLIINYLTNIIGIHTIDAKVRRSNAASVALFRKCGFVETGILPEHVRLADGWDDVVILTYIAK